MENALAAGSVSANPVMPLAKIGLTPIFPTTEVVPVLETPVFDNISKFPAEPRFIAVGLAANAAVGPIIDSTKKAAKVATENVLNFFIDYFLFIHPSVS